MGRETHVKDRGINDQSSLKEIYDYSIGVGGPIRQDRAWFYGTTRWWGAQSYSAGGYFNKSTSPYAFEPDLTRPSYTNQFYVDSSIRVTWQAIDRQWGNFDRVVEQGLGLPATQLTQLRSRLLED